MSESLCIGGGSDGVRHYLDAEVIKLPTGDEGSPLFYRMNPASAPRYELYYRERLRCNQREWVFYRHQSLTLEQAIDLLFERYGK